MMNDTVKIKMVLQEVTLQVKQLLQERLHAVILFGSYARGDNSTESDIDIMLLLNGFKSEVLKYRRDISKIASHIGLKYDVVISILFRTNTEFTEGVQYLPFYQNIVREGIQVYG